MKIQLDIKGKPIAGREFAQLRAALVSSQAATPTAAASIRAVPALDHVEALARLFADGADDAQARAALHGSFRHAARLPGGEPER